MKFSITTPSYNGFPMLKQACGSVRGQTGISREHMVRDGGSSDETEKWLMDFKGILTESQSSSFLYPSLDEGEFQSSPDSDYNFKYVSEPDNGMYDAINKGWASSDGDILSWLNCDEQYLPGTLAKVEQIFKENPDIEVVYGNALIVDDKGKLITVRQELQANSFLIRNTFLNVFSCATFFRRSLHDKGLLHLDDNYRYAADMKLMLELLRNDVKMYQINDYLSLFSVSGENLSTHQGMHDETLAIQNAYGALPGVTRKIAKVIRLGLRLLHGHYKKQQVIYKYAANENPDYMEHMGKADGKFSY